MRAHQPGSTPIDIPETVPNPVHTPAPAPERAPIKVPEKVPEKVIAPASLGHYCLNKELCIPLRDLAAVLERAGAFASDRADSTSFTLAEDDAGTETQSGDRRRRVWRLGRR
jgi:hypothetical protein